MRKHTIAMMLALVSMAATAKVELPNFMGDNMVLQQQTEAALWGTATPGKKVTIRPSWTKTKTTVVADAETGRWSTRIATPAAGGPYDIEFSDGEKLIARNVLIGEVWLCSGQSNMEMFVKGFGSQPVVGSTEVIANARPCTPIRMCTIQKRSMSSPQDTVITDGWHVNEPQAVADASAVAYFFAKTLNDALGIPVGLLITNWGGSSIETWLDEATIREGFPEFDLSYLSSAGQDLRNNQKPCLLYNGQVHALVPYTFKGMIWYQGETNRGNPDQYVRLQTAYAKMMREKFEVPDAPFYFVQIAPYPYGAPDSWQSGYFCEAQQKTLATIAHSGMATTLDIGEWGTIHPCQKKPVGQRLAWLALQNDYGVRGIEATAPTYKSLKVEGNKAIVTFNVGPMGLAPMGQWLEGFEVAGEDRVFHAAKAMRTGGDRVEVSSDEVAQPVAVRYCFRNWGVGTLFNNFGIPAAPFRTDDWNL